MSDDGRVQKAVRVSPELWGRLKSDPAYADKSDQFLLESALQLVDTELQGDNRKAKISARLDRLERMVGMDLMLHWYQNPTAAKLTAEDVQRFKAFVAEVVGDFVE